MLIDYKKIPALIDHYELNTIKHHLLNNTIKNIDELEQDLRNKSKKEMKRIIDTTVDYMEAVTGNKYGPQVFNNPKYLEKIESFYLAIKLMLFDRISKFKSIIELIALLQIETIPMMIEWDVNEAINIINNVFKELGYSKNDYSIEIYSDEEEEDERGICDIDITFIKDGNLSKNYHNDGLLLTHHKDNGIRITMIAIIEELILKDLKYTGGNE